MASSSVLFLHGFLEDEPTSTTIIARGLISALKKKSSAVIQCREYTPKMLLPLWLQGRWGIRFAHFFLYLFQVPGKTESITHMLDYGYAYLFHFRKPQKTVVTVTDLMPVLWWKGLLPLKAKKVIPLTVLYSLYALKRVQWITTISNNTKNDLVKLIGCDPSKISVIYLGVDEQFKQYDHKQKMAVRSRFFGSAPRKIILVTGSQFYKNHETALQTIEFLVKNGLQDVFLAKTGIPSQDWLNLVDKYGLAKNVLNIGFVPREQMTDLYNAVDILFFPSLYEGFGLPPLEAMACGTPAITSNVASLPEIMGDLDTMCDPYDIAGFAAKIEMVLFDEIYRQEIIQRGFVQASKFTWDRTAEKMMAVYKNISS